MSETDGMTDAECQKVLNGLLDFYWFKIRTRMLLLGETYEQARDEIMREMTSDEPKITP